jgi:hypothetical protein
MEEKLWKLCFYVKIEEYRKSIRKTVLLRDSDEGPAANPGESSRVMKAKTHLAKLISAFSKFLSDGTSFYQEFMLKVRVALNYCIVWNLVMLTCCVFRICMDYSFVTP